MSETQNSRFVYAIYIRTTPEKLFQALTDPTISPRYWRGMASESEWKPGAAWRLLFPDGRVADSGEVLECDPPRRLALRWRNEWKPEAAAEGWARCVFDIEPFDGCVKLTLDHSMERPDSVLIGLVSGGWPQVLSGLKSLLENGEPLFPPRWN